MKVIMTIPVGSKHEQIDFDLTGKTAFQIETVRRIVEAPDFDFSCHDQVPAREGPFMFLWYAKNGELNALRIGKQRLLWEYAV